MNNNFEFCFNIVYDNWRENNVQPYIILFIDADFYGPDYICEHKRRFMSEVASKIFENNPFIDEIKCCVIEDMIIKKRYELNWNHTGFSDIEDN